jgi:Domain of unknown function (DUF6484)
MFFNSAVAIEEPAECGCAHATESESAGRKIEGVVVGRLIALRATGEPLVDFPGNLSPIALPARSVLPLEQHKIGCEILLAFDAGDPEKPIVIGTLENFAPHKQTRMSIKLDEESIVLNAEREIVLQCGKASITLTRAGKVLIRGAYVLSRSSGANRIKGGSVQIN